jgi:hypothetical protein
MTVKADGPADVDRRTEHKGSSVGTPGMSALDEEREASLADEGGASGALVESQDRAGGLQPVATRRHGPGFWLVAGMAAAGALGMLALRRRR